eukprot:7006843-Alexandrium_andersonii.AAC.1
MPRSLPRSRPSRSGALLSTLYAASDFNADLACPRGDGEAEVALRVEYWLASRGPVAVGPAGPAR